jgi:hypothetical protein
MGRLRGKKPSPAMTVAIVALVFAVAGTSVAGVATISVLNKKEKKQTRNIAKDEIKKAAPGLSVANATNAGNANTLGGLSAAQLQQPIAYGDFENNALVAGSAKNVNSVRDTGGAGTYCIDVSITPVVAVASADPGDFRYANASAVPSGCNPGEDISVFTKVEGGALTDSDFNFVAFGSG